jgi:hypothetical protein
LCEAYGAAAAPRAVLDALTRLQARERRRIIRFSARGREPWASFAARGDVAQMDAEADWLAAARRDALAAPSPQPAG